jgi:hypothetical protein
MRRRTRPGGFSVLAFFGAFAFTGLLNCGSDSRSFEGGHPAAATPGDDGGGSASPSPSPGSFVDAATGDTGPAVCTEDIDVVLVLDVSSSMDFVLDKLDAEIAKVVTASNKLKNGAHFGLVLFVDNVAIDTTGSESGGKVHTTANTLQAAFQYAKQTYTFPNRNPGDGPSGPDTQNPICEEDSLDALHDAATDFPWRQNAAHIVIVVTDDTFLESTDNYGDRDGDGKEDKTNFPREGNYPARFTLDETVSELKKDEIRVFSFTKLKPPGLFDFTKCGTGRRHSTDDCVTYGWTKPYNGKTPIPVSTGGKNFDLDAVRSGTVSLADTINEVVLESHCAGPPK